MAIKTIEQLKRAQQGEALYWIGFGTLKGLVSEQELIEEQVRNLDHRATVLSLAINIKEFTSTLVWLLSVDDVLALLEINLPYFKRLGQDGLQQALENHSRQFYQREIISDEEALRLSQAVFALKELK